MVLPLGGEGFEIYRSSLLDYIHTDEYIVLLSIRKDEKAEDILEKHGYIKNENYYDVRGDIGGNYLEYLERTNNDINFSYVTKEDRPDIYSGEYYESKPFDHSAIDRVFEVINTLPCDKTFFDIGCGKGQMLMMASMYDMERIGGIDFNTDLVNTAKSNMHILGIDADIISGDASIYNGYDDYSIFFLYNPFGEKTVLKVMENIQQSYQRKRRKIFLIYGNPFYHKALVLKDGIDLYKQVRVDLYDPLLNIYSIGMDYE